MTCVSLLLIEAPIIIIYYDYCVWLLCVIIIIIIIISNYYLLWNDCWNCGSIIIHYWYNWKKLVLCIIDSNGGRYGQWRMAS